MMTPRIFVGSSVEGLRIAYAIQENLEHDAKLTIWTQGVFRPGSYILEDLESQLKKVEYGIFVFTPDDILTMGNAESFAVRDNVLFELGLFIGKLGRKRNFIIQPERISNFRIASDLLGVTPLTYDKERFVEEPLAALGSACNKIRWILEQDKVGKPEAKQDKAGELQAKSDAGSATAPTRSVDSPRPYVS